MDVKERPLLYRPGLGKKFKLLHTIEAEALLTSIGLEGSDKKKQKIAFLQLELSVVGVVENIRVAALISFLSNLV